MLVWRKEHPCISNSYQPPPFKKPDLYLGNQLSPITNVPDAVQRRCTSMVHSGNRLLELLSRLSGHHIQSYHIPSLVGSLFFSHLEDLSPYTPAKPPAASGALLGIWTSGSEMAAQREDTSCPAGYFHYTCNFNGHSYAGCCRVDACKQNPVGCPLAAQPRISTTKTSTSLESSSSLSSSPAPTTLETPTFLSSAGATFPAATAVSSADGNSNHGILIPLGGLIALVVIPAVVAVAGAILAWQRWCKRRDSKAEDGAIAAPDLPAMYQAPKSTPVPLPDHQEGTFHSFLPQGISD
ncbi:hypothetical protein QBC34DRAFT_89420 [Podospora aff. communis PSN243]|uniref:Uncharacterized protein n=1 Tax=Podospora aff. communis PSN243 TaxID=3040156 RepID=A0AAV9GLJ2_9PEZI|nr:hypothetical protein QBC34DRAFT_89420 [Podospora aff. communis PSN243]